MLWTLQKYIFREMGKTFLLTALGLIAVIGLGGGVMNMIELEGVTVGQMLKIIGLILPVAATLTLPIAALYAATVTYGRLSADNEFVACRSGGINIHFLFLPTVIISLLSAGCSFYFINFMIPNMIHDIERYFGEDLPKIIKQRFGTADRLSLPGDVVIYADKAMLREPKSSVAEDENAKSSLRLEGVAFVEMNDAEWSRFGTAESAQILFGQSSGRPTLAAEMRQVSLYDMHQRGFLDMANPSLGEFEISQTIPLKVKWLTLDGLIQYGRQPSLFPEIQDRMRMVRGAIARAKLYEETKQTFITSWDTLKDFGRIKLSDGDRRYTIESTSIRAEARPYFMDNVRITEETTDGFVRTVTADEAYLEVDASARLAGARVSLRALGNVEITDPRAGGPIQRDEERLPSLAMPEEILRKAQAISDDKLLDPGARVLDRDEGVEKLRTKLMAEVEGLSLDITGEIHSRLAFSMSAFVLVILGAALGMVFRGAQVLVAFGISFVPSLFVICTIIMGKQLIDNPGTTPIVGVLVVWAGIVTVALVDLFVMMKVLRR
jgi:lipopolysaccharide export LptBFGC system permease protein LptF